MKLPEPIRGREPGTWAESTVTVRIPEIARRTLIENAFPSGVRAAIEQLIAEIPNQPIRLLHPDGGPDVAEWNAHIRPFLDQNWLDPPWFFVETYFYRRIIEAVGYFRNGHDPFSHQKRQGLEISRSAIHALGYQLQSRLDNGWNAASLAALLAVDLWGNQADLSMWPAENSENPAHADLKQAEAFLLVNDTAAVAAHLLAEPIKRVDFMVDNAGFELVGDLCLADYLLSSQAAVEVVLQLKLNPTFVSDATVQDVAETISFLAASPHPPTAAWGQRLQAFVANGRLQLHTHPFWTSPLAFWDMPDGLRAALTQSDLIISKGDANYRRILGDRHWPFTTPFDEIMAYAPAPLLALRTLKAELACGLKAEQIEHLNEEDPTWQVNGRWGVIQFTNKL